jgi:hypothetical protein
MGGNRGAARRGRGRSVAFTGVLVLVFSLLNMAAAMAAPPFSADIVINETETGDEDSVELLRTISVPLEFQGQECTARSVGRNQSSVHPGNDLLVASGGTQVEIPDVERAPDAVVEGIGTLVLGSQISVSVRYGVDEFFSADLIVEVRCTGTDDTGRIIVVKQVTGGSDTSQAFQFTADYDADGFSLSDGQQNDSGDLDPGTYSVSEVVPDGWALQSAVCDDQSAPDAIGLSAGETVTCTFTNTESQVGASILVTVTPGCEITGAGPSGQVNVTMSVAGGAEVVVRDSGGQIVGSLTQDGTLSVAPGATYTWEATPNSGFVFPPDFQSSGTITVEDCAEVGASILVTVSSSCIVSGTEGIGRVSVSMSVAGGADVVIRDSAGDVVDTLTADGSVEVPEGEVYTWVATPNPGFEFPAGFDNTGSVTIETCSNPEVLPFTGIDADWLASLGILLLVAGGMTLITAKTSRPQKS